MRKICLLIVLALAAPSTFGGRAMAAPAGEARFLFHGRLSDDVPTFEVFENGGTLHVSLNSASWPSASPSPQADAPPPNIKRLSSMNIEAWLLGPEGTAIVQRHRSVLAMLSVGGVAHETTGFVFDLVPDDALAAVVLRVDGKFSVHDIWRK